MPTPPSFDLETITDKSEEWSPQTLNAPAKISPSPTAPNIFCLIPLFSALNSGGILNVLFSVSPPKAQVSLGVSCVSDDRLGAYNPFPHEYFLYSVCFIFL